MKSFIKVFLISIFLFGCQNNQSKKKIDDKSFKKQTSINTSEKHTNLLYKIKTLDSLFFEVAYNKCDSLLGRKLISKDFEFYHDKSGALLDESNEFASDIMVEDLSWICINTYRKLVDNSIEIFPLYKNRELYGVVQEGNHQFFKVENKRPTELISNAKFIHIWILEGDDWKLKRVFSFDHNKNDTTNNLEKRNTELSSIKYIPKNKILFDTIVALDKIYWDAYNNGNVNKVIEFMTDDHEFYHDEEGELFTKEKNAEVWREFYKMDLGVVGETVEGTNEIYEISGYGALQIFYQRFYDKKNPEWSKPGRAITLWKDTPNGWLQSRVFSLH